VATFLFVQVKTNWIRKSAIKIKDVYYDLYMFFHTLKQCTHKCTILLLMTKMEVSWKYDIQNGYAKIIPPKIPDRISLMLISYNITTSNTRKDLLILSWVSCLSVGISSLLMLCIGHTARLYIST
jgi:hypothetical protein